MADTLVHPRPAIRIRRSAIGWSAIALTIAIGCVFAYPMLFAAVQAVRTTLTGTGGLLSGATVAQLPHILGDTAIVVVLGAGIAVVVGAALACVNERTDAALGLVGELLPLIPLIVPPIAGVIGWAVLLDPSAGLLNAAIRAMLAPVWDAGDSGPLDIYSRGGLIAMTGLALVPYVHLIVAAALRHLDPSIEEAARVFGTKPLRVLWRVTLPAIAPAIAASFLVAIVAGLGLFSVPIVLGTAARIEVISVTIFRLLNSYPPDTSSALVLAVLLSLIVQGLLWTQRLITREGRNVAVGGRGMRVAPMRLGRWRTPARLLTILYIVATGVLPIAALALVSLQPFWTPTIDWSVLSLDNFRSVLSTNATTREALANSFGLGAIVATLAMALAALLTLGGSGASDGNAGRRRADRIMSLPATVPHTFIGVNFLLAFSVAPFRLYGSVAILLLAYLVMGLPFAARAAAAAASGIGRELAEAARVAGAGEGRTLRRVLLPLALPGLAAGWIIVFVHSADELTASAFLSGPSNPVIGRVLMDFWIFGNFPQVAALALVMSAVNAIGVAAMLVLSRRASGRRT